MRVVRAHLSQAFKRWGIPSAKVCGIRNFPWPQIIAPYNWSLGPYRHNSWHVQMWSSSLARRDQGGVQEYCTSPNMIDHNVIMAQENKRKQILDDPNVIGVKRYRRTTILTPKTEDQRPNTKYRTPKTEDRGPNVRIVVLL